MHNYYRLKIIFIKFVTCHIMTVVEAETRGNIHTTHYSLQMI